MNRSWVGVVLHTVLIWQLGCSGGDPTATDPELIFKDGFENSLEEIELLADGGVMVRGFSAWLKILPKQTDIHLRNEADYLSVDCQAPAAWFLEVTGDEVLSKYQSHLNCQQYSDNRFDFDNGRWLVTDNSSGIVYYRVWKLNR
ncbi:MAG: hypothetical protein ABW104_20425 [Candidatus Thiodiazotropha sp. 6PLUC2]